MAPKILPPEIKASDVTIINVDSDSFYIFIIETDANLTDPRAYKGYIDVIFSAFSKFLDESQFSLILTDAETNIKTLILKQSQ